MLKQIISNTLIIDYIPTIFTIPRVIQFIYFFDNSFDDGINDVLQSNNIILYFGGVLLLIFIMLVLGRFNSIEQRVRLSKLFEIFIVYHNCTFWAN